MKLTVQIEVDNVGVNQFLEPNLVVADLLREIADTLGGNRYQDGTAHDVVGPHGGTVGTWRVENR